MIATFFIGRLWRSGRSCKSTAATSATHSQHSHNSLSKKAGGDHASLGAAHFGSRDHLHRSDFPVDWTLLILCRIALRLAILFLFDYRPFL